MMKITPVLLAGGSGTRLWPISRKSFPKQFSKIIGVKSLFENTCARFRTNPVVEFSSPITITNSDFRFIVKEQLGNAFGEMGDIILEPEAKNTAPAVIASATFALKKNPNSILLVTPTDHYIPNVSALLDAIKIGLKTIEQGKIALFGIPPSRPVTGYGYLELGEEVDKGRIKLKKFIEKPEKQAAKQMLKTGNFLWNSGIFLFRAKDIIEAAKKYQPTLLNAVSESVDMGVVDLEFWRLDRESWSKSPSISLDHGLMEKSSNLVVTPFNDRWTDLGDWSSVWETSITTNDGVVKSENVTSLDCKNSLLRAESRGQHLVALGLENVIAVAMNDAVLVANREKSQEVKKLVEALSKKKVSQAEVFPVVNRPWGLFEVLLSTDRFKVKRIIVYPHGCLSLQSHRYRSEHWVNVEGEAKVTIGNVVSTLKKGQSVYIPMGAKHRLENVGHDDLTLIEIQTGDYFGEDDIVRYEDIYARI